MFYIAVIFVKYCYATSSWLFWLSDLWANMRCLGLSLLGDKELWETGLLKDNDGIDTLEYYLQLF